MNNQILSLGIGGAELMSMFAVMYAVAMCAVVIFVLVMISRLVRANERTAAALEDLARQRSQDRNAI